MCLAFVYHIFGSCKLMCLSFVSHILEVANLTINFMCLSFVFHIFGSCKLMCVSFVSYSFWYSGSWKFWHMQKNEKKEKKWKKRKKWDKTNKKCKKVIKSDKKCFFEIFNVLIWFKMFYWDYLCPMPSWTPSEVNPSCSRRAKVLVIDYGERWLWLEPLWYQWPVGNADMFSRKTIQLLGVDNFEP